ncbi:MAG: hypothetical protein JKX81_05120 [Arenicella sp.]|nr:hypothetical protein [Arenicella sp.]
MNPAKRKSLLALSGVAVSASLAQQWTKPIVNCIVIPAHAATSAAVCSSFAIEAVNGLITIQVTDTQAIGPLAANRVANDFSVLVDEVVSPAGLNVQNIDQQTVFSGLIDTGANEIRGELTVLQSCDGQLVCEQIASYTVALSTAVLANGVGQYDGQLSGTLRCCQDFIV